MRRRNAARRLLRHGGASFSYGQAVAAWDVSLFVAFRLLCPFRLLLPSGAPLTSPTLVGGA